VPQRRLSPCMAAINHAVRLRCFRRRQRRHSTPVPCNAVWIAAFSGTPGPCRQDHATVMLKGRAHGHGPASMNVPGSGRTTCTNAPLGGGRRRMDPSGIGHARDNAKAVGRSAYHPRQPSKPRVGEDRDGSTFGPTGTAPQSGKRLRTVPSARIAPPRWRTPRRGSLTQSSGRHVQPAGQTIRTAERLITSPRTRGVAS